MDIEYLSSGDGGGPRILFSERGMGSGRKRGA